MIDLQAIDIGDLVTLRDQHRNICQGTVRPAKRDSGLAIQAFGVLIPFTTRGSEGAKHKRVTGISVITHTERLF